MFHMNTDLMRAPGFQAAFQQCDIPEPFQNVVMGNGMFAVLIPGTDPEPEPVRRVTRYVTGNRSLVVFYISPHQGGVYAFYRMVKELPGKAELGFF
jgi:hypothetical protein